MPRVANAAATKTRGRSRRLGGSLAQRLLLRILINSYAMTRFSLALFSAVLLFAQPAARRLLKVDDMHRFHDVRDVQISPDGKWVAYTVSSVYTTADKGDTDGWIARWEGTQHVRLTSC